MQFTNRLAPGLVAGALLASGTTGVFAAKSARPQLRVVTGQVSNLSATGFTLNVPGRKVATGAAAPTPRVLQVSVTAVTKEIARKGTTGSLSDGEYVVVVGPRTATTVTARRILYSATPFKRRAVRALAGRVAAAQLHRAVGIVASTSSTTDLAITTKAGKTLTFSLTSTTKYREGKQLAASAPALTVGQRVIVIYSHDATSKTTLDARVVAVLPIRAASTPQP